MAELHIAPLASDEDARHCATLMASTDPWLTLGRKYDDCLAAVRDPSREVYVAKDVERIAGFIILNMQGAFVGYIQAICVDKTSRCAGVGTGLIDFAEKRIFKVSPNAFLCVSSFNARARSLYERLGYRVVGELADYIVRGYSETLMRKTTGPLKEFKPVAPVAEFRAGRDED